MIEVEIIECGKHSMKAKLTQDISEFPVRAVEFKKGQISGLDRIVKIKNKIFYKIFLLNKIILIKTKG